MATTLEGENLGAGILRKQIADRLRSGLGLKSGPATPPPAAQRVEQNPTDARAKLERRSALSPLDGRRAKRALPDRAVQLNVRIAESSKAALIELATMRGTSMVEVIEWAIELAQREQGN